MTETWRVKALHLPQPQSYLKSSFIVQRYIKSIKTDSLLYAQPRSAYESKYRKCKRGPNGSVSPKKEGEGESFSLFGCLFSI